MGVNNSYPEQYATDIDLYFDDTIKIPLSDKQRIYKKSDNYPEGITESYKSLEPVDLNDKQPLQTVKPVNFFLTPVIIFAVPLDDRFSSLGTTYYSNLVDGMSLLSLKSRILGGVAVPLALSFWCTFIQKSGDNRFTDSCDRILYRDKGRFYRR